MKNCSETVCCLLILTCFLVTIGHSAKECTVEGQIYKNCASKCDTTCIRPEVACTKGCAQRCECPMTKVLHEGRCIDVEECPINPEIEKELMNKVNCPPTFVWKQCGSACNRTCDKGKDPIVCVRVCSPRCGCPKETPYIHNNKCITYEECPKKNQSGSRSNDTGDKLTEAEKAAAEIIAQAYRDILQG